MSPSDRPQAQSRRPPLGDATRRVNNAHQSHSNLAEKQSRSQSNHESLKQDVQFIDESSFHDDRHYQDDSPSSSVPNPQVSAISKDVHEHNSNRNSQISTTSTNASNGRRRKTHIGPWHLGKTLGKGATARVRMARHAITGQPAAIKIVQKKNAQISQAGSLASLDRADAVFKESNDGFRRMPYGIEREVAIMKLIEHPHIMKLYDIWENRTEIYLVLEYVDNGELFEHISKAGRLREEEAMKYFRQLLSAVGYCHSFNICHRDLKPENILLTSGGDVKIADFGMAALQQTPEHRLQTSCGSPHYAAPEVIKAVPYRGDKVDIWSMGVILFAALSGRLPFDNASMPGLLAVIQKGNYRMASVISSQAADLIHRMLQVDPRERLNISQIWRHPVLRKYDYLDDFGGGLTLKLPTARDCGRPVLRRSDIDRELLRHLRSMWHQFEEQKLIQLLLNDQPNDQKLFYSLLLKHRENQLENYIPEIGYSNSDYHHGRPLSQIPKLSTRQFHQPGSNRQGRQISKFTVVNNVNKDHHRRKPSEYAETEAAETVLSYDPFKASRPHIENAVVGQANIVVHRNHSIVLEDGGLRPHARAMARTRPSSAAGSSGTRARQPNLAPPRVFASRSSLASSTRSRSSIPGVRPTIGHKRGVSFSRSRPVAGQRTVTDSQVMLHNKQYRDSAQERVDGHPTIASPHPSTHYIQSRKNHTAASQSRLFAKKPDRVSRVWHEDVRQLSTSLAKDCDEAFNRTSVVSKVHSRASAPGRSQSSEYEAMASAVGQRNIPLEPPAPLPRHVEYSRPLPPPPARSESINLELAEARLQAELRKTSGFGDDSPGYLERMVSHIDRLMQPSASSLNRNDDRDRRAASAPVNSTNQEAGRPLPSIYEFESEDLLLDRPVSDFENFIQSERVKQATNSRNASAPEAGIVRVSRHETGNRTPRRDGTASTALRLVEPSSPSPAKPPAPLNIRKQSSQGSAAQQSAFTSAGNNSSMDEYPPYSDLQQRFGSQQNINLSKIARGDETNYYQDPFGTDDIVRRKKPNWFKRNSRSSEDSRNQRIGDTLDNPDMKGLRKNVDNSVPNKKKSFGLGRLFRKRTSRQDGEMAISGFELYDEDPSIQGSAVEVQRASHIVPVTSLEGSRVRQIEPQQNWFARLFHVKPATMFMCFSVSKKRARQEVANLLKEWRKYGTKDIVVDKERNIVFGKIGAKNYLHLKEVSFACEIMTVIEHRKRGQLSIARFTQEKGAASSFHKVVETVEAVLKTRGMLVSDDRKRTMMIQTLNAS